MVPNMPPGALLWLKHYLLVRHRNLESNELTMAVVAHVIIDRDEAPVVSAITQGVLALALMSCHHGVSLFRHLLGH